jgi:alpha-tubulin suppressor-like RCC1 family protein
LKFAILDAGADHTCGLTRAGVAHCWGRNNRGQLGDGTTTDRSTPVPVTGGLTFQRIAAGGFRGSDATTFGFTCGLTTGGDVHCWGDNEAGQLGTGSANITAHPAPALVPATQKFITLTVGQGRHTCALTSAGAAWCWGENTFGALGDGSFSNRSSPVHVSGNVTFTAIVAGGFIGHTCGLTAAGTAYCWGENEVGAVGDGSTTDRSAPSPVAGGHSLSSIDAGLRHTCGRTTAGTVYCWGSNGAGQLGTGSTGPRTTPAKVAGQP